MFKGAIGIFAFSIFLFNCATPVTTPPLLFHPNLFFSRPHYSDISLNEGGKVGVRISNIGRGPAPHHVGSLVIYVDGHLKMEGFSCNASWSNLSSTRTFRPLYHSGCGWWVKWGSGHCRSWGNGRWGKWRKQCGLQKWWKRRTWPRTLLPDLTITDLSSTLEKIAVTMPISEDSPLPLGEEIWKSWSMDLKRKLYIRSLSELPFFHRKEASLDTPMTFVGRHEIDARIDFPSGSGRV